MWGYIAFNLIKESFYIWIDNWLSKAIIIAGLLAIKLVKIDIKFFIRQETICHVAIKGGDPFSRSDGDGNRAFFSFHVMSCDDEIEGTCDFALVAP